MTTEKLNDPTTSTYTFEEGEAKKGPSTVWRVTMMVNASGRNEGFSTSRERIVRYVVAYMITVMDNTVRFHDDAFHVKAIVPMHVVDFIENTGLSQEEFSFDDDRQSRFGLYYFEEEA